jgi:hypothetical protein
MATATTNAKADPTNHPIETVTPPPAPNAVGNPVMPPARMQMMANETAKFEKRLMRR